ncbi:MAG: aminoacyl-tRNA hydrolase [Acidobacteria bacterium]|nr:aminoacyl-tRNA hydrolase [Acidobacteriota bacterium]
MKLIIGLGNPGKIYQDHRHNIGFVVIKALAKTCRVFLKKESGVLALSAKIKIKGQNVVLAMPLTFMNLSGIAVSALLAKYKRDPEDLLVVCDD